LFNLKQMATTSHFVRTARKQSGSLEVRKRQTSSVSWVRNAPAASKQWHDLKVRISGNKVEAIRGKRYLEYTLAANVSGRVGLWSKADSYMHFSDYRVTPAD